MVELGDTVVSKAAAERHVGSTPTTGTIFMKKVIDYVEIFCEICGCLIWHGNLCLKCQINERKNLLAS